MGKDHRLNPIIKESFSGLAFTEQWPYEAVAEALEVIPLPRTEGPALSSYPSQAKHVSSGTINSGMGATLGECGRTGHVEPLTVKLHPCGTAVQMTALLLCR